MCNNYQMVGHDDYAQRLNERLSSGHDRVHIDCMHAFHSSRVRTRYLGTLSNPVSRAHTASTADCVVGRLLGSKRKAGGNN